jgi:hypothetical protein
VFQYQIIVINFYCRVFVFNPDVHCSPPP